MGEAGRNGTDGEDEDSGEDTFRDVPLKRVIGETCTVLGDLYRPLRRRFNLTLKEYEGLLAEAGYNVSARTMRHKQSRLGANGVLTPPESKRFNCGRRPSMSAEQQAILVGFVYLVEKEILEQNLPMRNLSSANSSQKLSLPASKRSEQFSYRIT